MADAVKHPPGGSVASDLRGLISVLRTRKTKVFAYGFVLTFVACTVFIAFNPNSGSASPWLNSLFTSASASAAPVRSQFNNLFNYIFPNSSSATSGRGWGLNVMPFYSNASSSPHPSEAATPGEAKAPPSSTNLEGMGVGSQQGGALTKNQISGGVGSDRNGTSAKNQTKEGRGSRPVGAPPTNKRKDGAGPQQKVAAELNNQTKQAAPASQQNGAPTKNQSSGGAPPAKDRLKAPIATSKDSPSGKNQTKVETPVSAATPPVATKNATASAGNQQKGLVGSPAVSNFSASLRKGNVSSLGSTAAAAGNQKGERNWSIQSLLGCDIFHGRWVKDESYPLYKEGSCPNIDEPFNCYLNGRPDMSYQKLRWQPTACNIPRLNPTDMLQRLRGKRLVFVGDSLNRNMWESLVCILRNSVKDKSKVFEASGRHEFRTEGAYSFVFKDYNCSVEFFRSPFLVQEWEMPDSHGKTKETLRLDIIEKSSSRYKDADIIVFNTGHWWTHEKTSKGKDYYQEGNRVYGELKVIEAFHKALNTWAKWVDANVDPRKSLVFFRGYSSSHFSGGRWNSGGQCDKESEPIKNETYLTSYPPKMSVLESVLKGMKTQVSYLNITRMTDYRKDAHPSVYRKHYLTEAERKSPERYQDCSHWCLPGVPDSWNELLYAQLLIKLHQKR
ncbi:hypothetical protein Taro_030450 [Colocasia esculenta]|uniref:Trichome birefringence-like N-terminal domain-containing protein n=1 Tax=Colocasia esculenta TaxID=4460 RepID=A0A843W3C7_COLES|nr:hypothetical protein [Colocasia esculenta]